MTIHADTSIGSILKHNPAALEAIVGLSSRFEKLRNPLLRKVIAGRTSIAMATKIGGCTVEDFFTVLRPLGFEIADPKAAGDEGDHPAPASHPGTGETPPDDAGTGDQKRPVPDFLAHLAPEKITDLDVRPILASGADPLREIVARTRSLKIGEALKIINTFEPTPLIQLLGKQGFKSHVEHPEPDRVDTYFFKETDAKKTPVPATPPEAHPGPRVSGESVVPGSLETDPASQGTAGWDQLLQRFSGAIQYIDVRKLEMPGPMHAILDALDSLPSGTALFVYHKRIPVFLLPELSERQFDYRIREIRDGEVNLLIFRK